VTKPTRVHLPAVTLGLLSALCACASDQSGPPVSVEDLAHLLAEGLCDNIGPCCAEAAYPHDDAQCRARAEIALRDEIIGLTGPNINYDSVAARGCVDAYAQMAQSCGTSDFGDPCANVFSGKLADGASCAQSAECASKRCASSTTAGGLQCLPTLKPAAHAKVGEDCNQTCGVSGTSSFCYFSGTIGTSSPIGGACYTSDGLLCDALKNVCVVIPAIGQSCATNFRCADGAFCDGTVCAAKRTSGSCALSSEACASSTFCDFTTEECLPRKARGAACTNTTECQADDRCYSGTCQRATIASPELCAGAL
jgi:hypothetical protein